MDGFFLKYHETFENIVIFGFFAVFLGFIAWCIYKFVHKLYQELPEHFTDTPIKKILSVFGCLSALAVLVAIVFGLAWNNLFGYVVVVMIAIFCIGIFLNIAVFYYELFFKNVSSLYAKIACFAICAILSLITLSIIGNLLQKFGVIDVLYQQ